MHLHKNLLHVFNTIILLESNEFLQCFDDTRSLCCLIMNSLFFYIIKYGELKNSSNLKRFKWLKQIYFFTHINTLKNRKNHSKLKHDLLETLFTDTLVETRLIPTIQIITNSSIYIYLCILNFQFCAILNLKNSLYHTLIYFYKRFWLLTIEIDSLKLL